MLNIRGEIWGWSINILIHIQSVTPYFVLLEIVDMTFTAMDPSSNYMFKVNNKNARTRCEICSKFTIKTPARRHWCRSGVFVVNFELFFIPCSSVSIVNFQQLVVEAYIFINTIQMQVRFPFGSSKIFHVAFKTSFTTCFEVTRYKDCLIWLSRVSSC